MPRMSDNECPSLRFAEQDAAPSATPGSDYAGIPTGDQRLYFDSGSHGLFRVDHDGNAFRVGTDVDPTIGGSAPGAATNYLRISLDGGTTWFRVALSPDS